MITSKLPNVGTTIFTVMSKMAQEYNAINLSQGFPDFNCSDELISLVNKYMRKGHNQYAPMPGVLQLREAISEKNEKLYARNYNPDTEITVTAGATQALFTAITAFIKEDDEVMIFEPAYDSYVPAIDLCGGQPVYVKLKEPDYTIDWDEVKKSLTARTKMIILNSPHNPSGSILSESDIEELTKLVSGSKVIILSDEVYEHMVFDENIHLSIARYPKLAERSMIISSFGKTFHTTGWKVGYCLAPESLMKEYRKVHQFNVFSVNTPIQYAYADFLRREETYSGLSDFYQQKRDKFVSLLSKSKFKVIPSKGTYFQLADYSEISEEKDTVFVELLAKEYGVAAVPVSVFYHESTKNKVIRFCFAKEDNTLIEAANRLVKL